jgi:hypothetical protein
VSAYRLRTWSSGASLHAGATPSNAHAARHFRHHSCHKTAGEPEACPRAQRTASRTAISRVRQPTPHSPRSRDGGATAVHAIGAPHTITHTVHTATADAATRAVDDPQHRQRGREHTRTQTWEVCPWTTTLTPPAAASSMTAPAAKPAYGTSDTPTGVRPQCCHQQPSTARVGAGAATTLRATAASGGRRTRVAAAPPIQNQIAPRS